MERSAIGSARIASEDSNAVFGTRLFVRIVKENSAAGQISHRENFNRAGAIKSLSRNETQTVDVTAGTINRGAPGHD